MNKVLIIYENIPESTDFYALEVSDKDLKWMKKCHGNFVNTKMAKAAEKACNKLSEFLTGKAKAEYKPGVPFDVFTPTIIIHTGFVM